MTIDPAPIDQANALVNDLGLSPGVMAFESWRSGLDPISSSNVFTGNIGATKTLVWGLQPENSFNFRYGNQVGVSAAQWAPGKWACQSTGFVKTCLVQGYNGSNKVYEESVDLRVYREVVVSNVKYWNEDYSRVQAPILPFNHYQGFDTYGSGSIPIEMSLGGNAFYNVMFVGWQDYLGHKRFALVDYYPVHLVSEFNFKLQTYVAGISSTTAYPKNSSSASGSTALASNFIKNNYTTSGSISGGYGTSGQGKIILPKIQGQNSTSFYLTDGLPSQIKAQSTAIPKRVVSAPTVKPAFFTGSDLVLIDDTNSSDIPNYQPPGVAYSNSLTTPRTVHSQFYVLEKNVKKQILIPEDSYQELKILLQDIATTSSTSALTKINGITLVHGTNYIQSNLGFTDGNITIDNWGVSKRKGHSEYFGGHVVDGNSITGSSTLLNAVAAIEGYIGTTTTQSSYYYLLPGYSRTQDLSVSSTAASHRDLKITASQAITGFTTSDLAQRGRHGGKFLKSAGFTTSGIGAYLLAFEARLKDQASRNLAGKVFNAYFYGYDPRQPTLNAFRFSLEGFPGIPSKAGMPSSLPGSQTPPVDNTDTTKAKYMNVINTASSAINSGKTVNSEFLFRSLSDFLKIGVPLATLKAEVLNGLAEGKIAYLEKKNGTTRAAALKEWEKDPLYIAINKFFTTNSSNAYTSSSGSGGSGNSGAKNNKNGKNNKNNKTGKNTDTKEASTQSETIKITVTRGLAGYRTGVRSTGNTSSRPTLIQTYEGIKSSKQINGTPIRSFEFPFVPSQVVYSGLGINWTEIERTGSYPIVDWTSFQLLKISFSFDIVSMAQANTAGFGLYYSCEDQITELREMAQSPYPVTFLNMDKFMQDEIRWPSLNTGRGVEFVIQEFSVTAVQRTQANPAALKDSTVPNRISRASCTMTLQEIPIEQVDIVQMPPIKPCKKECDKDKIITQQDSTRLLFTPTIVTRFG